MPKRIKFDSTYNTLPPTLVLATRSGHKLGVIPAYNVKVKEATECSEMSFRVNKYDNHTQLDLWDKIVDFKLVWCREWDVWFEIYVDLEESGGLTKNIVARSLAEAELSQINLYDIEINTEADILREDYSPTVLYDTNDENASLLHRLLDKAPHYRIGHVDVSIATIQRTFTFSGTTIYDALQEIAQELNCVFILGSGSDADGKIDRVINAYDLESFCLDCNYRGDFLDVCPECGRTNTLNGYGEDTTICVSVDNLADNITYSVDAGSVKNCFKLIAGDDLMTATIANCNPNGTDYLWYISDAIKSDMSNELVVKLEEYETANSYYQDGFQTDLSGDLLNEYNKLVSKYANAENELSPINELIVGYSKLMEAYYNTVDMELYLTSGMMPPISTASTSASEEIAKLRVPDVAVLNLDTITAATATSAVLSIARTKISSGYQITANNYSIDENKVWHGIFTITNYSNEEDTASSSLFAVGLVDGDEAYTRQRLDKTLFNNSDNAVDIISLFAFPDTVFKSELNKYCLNRLVSFHDACERCLNVLIEQGAATTSSSLYKPVYYPYYQKLGYLQEAIADRESEIETVAGKYDSKGKISKHGLQTLILDIRNEIQNTLDLKTFLGVDLWKEFAAYRREDTYQNDNYISDGLNNAELFENAREFYSIAEREIFKAATMQHSITATLKNLLAMKEFAALVDKFALYNWIRVIVDKNIYRLRLVEYEIDYDTLTSLPVVFSDVTTTRDGTSDVKSVLDRASSMATSYGSVSRQASRGNSGNEQLNNWVEKGLALTKLKIIDDVENQNMIVDDKGMLCREYLPITDDYDRKQLKIINRGLYLTDNWWETAKVGVGDFEYYDPETGETKEAYGVIADTIIGNLILSEKVGVYNTTGSTTIDKDGVKIITNIDGSKPLIVQRRDGSDGNYTYSDLLTIDSEGHLVLNNYATSGSVADAVDKLSGSIDEAKRYATDYLTFDDSGLTVGFSGSSNRVNITSGSVTVGDPTNENVYTDANGVYIRNGSTLLSQFKQSEAIIGRVASNMYNTRVTQNGVYLRKNTSVISSFEAGEITLGDTDDVYSQITTNGMTINQGNTGTLASFTANSATIGKTSGYNTVMNASGVSINNNGTTLASFTGSQIVLGQTNGYNTLLDLSGMTVRTGSTALAQFSGNGVDLYRSSGDTLGSMSYSRFSAGGYHASDYGLLIEGTNRVGIGVDTSAVDSSENYKLVVGNNTITYRGGYSTAPWAIVTYSGTHTFSSTGVVSLAFSGSSDRITSNWSIGSSDHQFGYSTSYGIRVPYSGHIKVWASAYFNPDQNPDQCGVYVLHTSDYSMLEEVNGVCASTVVGGVACAPKIISVQDGDYFTLAVKIAGGAGICDMGNESTFLMVQYV